VVGEELPKTEPMIYFLDCCTETIRTLPLLEHDENKTEDVDTDGEDHAGDETRYAVMSRPWIIDETRSPDYTLPNAPQRFTINELIERQTERRRQREAD
jgi:hypothetical protein